MNKTLFCAFAAALAVPAFALAFPNTEPLAAQEPARPPDVIFIPSSDAVIAAMLRLGEVSRTDVVYDLGCGDGRIVIEAARRAGARGVC